MQPVIYADVLVFVNTVVTFLLLLTVRLFTGAQSKTGRMLCASFAGGVYSLVMLAPPLRAACILL